MPRAKRKPNVRQVMSQFLGQFAKSYKLQREKLHGIVKFREELGPEWCLKVTGQLDDVIEEFQRVRSALDIDQFGVAQSGGRKRIRDERKTLLP
jgi:hypothetical protein